VLVGALGVALNRQAFRSAKLEPNDVAVIAPRVEMESKPPPATFVSTSDAIAIPLESPADNVTVVQVYPTIDTERRWQLETTLTTTSATPLEVSDEDLNL
jgi:hypothetical protein